MIVYGSGFGLLGKRFIFGAEVTSAAELMVITTEKGSFATHTTKFHKFVNKEKKYL